MRQTTSVVQTRSPIYSAASTKYTRSQSPNQYRRKSMPLVVFLRGVNVGGHKTFRPSVLAKELAEFDTVNIGAAGTFVVKKSISQSKLRAELQKRLPFDTEIMICSAKEIIDIAASDPFAGEPATSD